MITTSHLIFIAVYVSSIVVTYVQNDKVLMPIEKFIANISEMFSMNRNIWTEQ